MRRIFTFLALIIILAACASPSMIATASLGQTFSKPELAAQRLYSAYKHCNRVAALKAASSPAVRTLFRKNCQPGDPKWEFMGCERTGTSFSCSYYYEGGGVNMNVVRSAPTSYSVKSVSFIAD
ncbi:MAG TPA: hypothetical protein VF708_07510 [Pyrinomonadaceae bacterium]